MVTSFTDNATAMKDTTGFSTPVEDVEQMRPSTESPVSASSDITEIIMETVSRATPFLNAMSMRDTMPLCKLVFVLMELNLSEENVRRFLSVLLTHTTTLLAVFATQDSNSTPKISVFLSLLSSPTALLTQDSTESHVPATLEFSNNLSMLALPAPLELNGMDRSVTRSLLKLVLMDTSSTKTSCNVNLQLLHAETTPTSMEPLAYA